MREKANPLKDSINIAAYSNENCGVNYQERMWLCAIPMAI
jgi:hypothetical protein